jgi:hypothetical protein
VVAIDFSVTRNRNTSGRMIPCSIRPTGPGVLLRPVRVGEQLDQLALHSSAVVAVADRPV